MNRLATAIVFVLACSAFIGCSVYDPGLIKDEGNGGRKINGGLPPRPNVPDDGTDTGTASFAITNIIVDQKDAWKNVGLNLDGFDTTETNPVGECKPPDQSQGVPLDGDNGIDNQIGQKLLVLVNALIPGFQVHLNDAHKRGEGTILWEISEWNGTANDSKVRITIYVAADGTSLPADEVHWDDATRQLLQNSDDMPAPPPDYSSPSGRRTFFVRASNFTTGGSPTPFLLDTNGYVSDGTMVFRYPSGKTLIINEGEGSLNLRLSEGFLLAKFAPDFKSISSGFLAGRFPVTDLLEAGGSIGICGCARCVIEDNVYTLADVLSAESSYDGTGNQDCDALSIGIPYDGVAADIETVDKNGALFVTRDPRLPDFCVDMGMTNLNCMMPDVRKMCGLVGPAPAASGLP
ncbi:MAG: hypothetical protein KC543_11560 [Myxococcales bacterium]|nr:hypothetical protein [Myxococcales bacterium]